MLFYWNGCDALIRRQNHIARLCSGKVHEYEYSRERICTTSMSFQMVCRSKLNITVRTKAWMTLTKPTHAVNYCKFRYNSHVHFQVSEKEKEREGRRKEEREERD